MLCKECSIPEHDACSLSSDECTCCADTIDQLVEQELVNPSTVVRRISLNGSDSRIISELEKHNISKARLERTLNNNRENWGKLVNAYEVITVLSAVMNEMNRRASESE